MLPLVLSKLRVQALPVSMRLGLQWLALLPQELLVPAPLVWEMTQEPFRASSTTGGHRRLVRGGRWFFRQRCAYRHL
jgi:hypothetical protein